MDNSVFGLIGLGVMGRNLILNVADHGYAVSGYDPDLRQSEALNKEKSNAHRIQAFHDLPEFISSLESPKKIMLLVPAGAIVDQVIDQLSPHLSEGDIVIDGGNSHFIDTQKRERKLAQLGIHFLGTGVSGGAQGARKGPSLMPGGSKDAYSSVAPLFEAISAKYKGSPCVDYVGKSGAGNFVKMVHNGIEYAMMQSIAELYGVFKAYGISNQDISSAFKSYQSHKLTSFLIDITYRILLEKDSESSADLVDMILDKAKQKGTGKWTSQNAMDLGIAVPSIDMAVSYRALSAQKSLRVKLSERVDSTTPEDWEYQDLVHLGEESLLAAFFAAYAQGLHQIWEGSKQYDFEIQLVSVIKLWRGGCIIQSELLNDIYKSFENEPINHLFESKNLFSSMSQAFESLRVLAATALNHRIPIGTLTTALSYYDTLHQAQLPLNLVQAQRDFFGSHTFERVDRPGIFHHNWPEI